MLKLLPHDVEEYIYNFLIMPLDICKLKCISKEFTKITNNINFVKKKILLQERANMLLEDITCKNEKLASNWEYYMKWNWPKYSDKEKNYTPLWKIGQYVDVLDRIQVWGSAKIIDMELVTYTNSINKIQTDRRYYIQFLGWSKNFNEWVTGEKITFFGSKTINPRNKMQSLNDVHKRWALYNNGENDWTMEILTIKDNKKNEKIIQLVGFQNNVLKLDTITPENINSKLRAVTNASVLFSFTNRKFDETRILKY